jgi:hypothetical protein
MLQFVDVISDASLDHFIPQASTNEEDNLIEQQKNRELL